MQSQCSTPEQTNILNIEQQKIFICIVAAAIVTLRTAGLPSLASSMAEKCENCGYDIERLIINEVGTDYDGV